jgi:hypothetical protein
MRGINWDHVRKTITSKRSSPTQTIIPPQSFEQSCILRARQVAIADSFNSFNEREQ